METRSNEYISDARLTLSKVLEQTPIQVLWSEFVYFNRESSEFTFGGSELPQAGKTNTFLNDICRKHLEISTQLDELACKVTAKERLRNKLVEETLFFVLASRYFNTVAFHFAKHATPDKMALPLVSASSTTTAGLVVSPGELADLLGTHSFNYTHYLLALLELSEMVVDYTTNTIINLSTDPQADTFAVKRQYSLSLLNLGLLNKLQAAFQLLDLKNDGVRRKYDRLKYSLKKINGMVYDLSLRKLILFLVDLE